MTIVSEHCTCRRVEWHWSYSGSGQFGTAVCHDCRAALRYTSVPNFVEMIFQHKLIYMPTEFVFLSAMGHEKAQAGRRKSLT